MLQSADTTSKGEHGGWVKLRRRTKGRVQLEKIRGDTPGSTPSSSRERAVGAESEGAPAAITARELELEPQPEPESEPELEPEPESEPELLGGDHAPPNRSTANNAPVALDLTPAPAAVASAGSAHDASVHEWLIDQGYSVVEAQAVCAGSDLH